jgi:hypothetical protein
MPESEQVPADSVPDPESDVVQGQGAGDEAPDGAGEVEPAPDAAELAPPMPAHLPSVPSPTVSRWSRLSRTSVLLLGVGLGAAVVGAGWLATFFGSSSDSRTGSFTTDGTITLTEVGAGRSSGGSCSGTGGYSDIGLGTQVNISDASGTLVAHGVLGLGETSGVGCEFPFTVDDVTPGSKFYTVEVAHRGGLTQTEAELREGGLAFTLGD